MANNRKKGTLGLSIPVINTSSAPKNKLTVEEVIKWRAALPLADIGAASKKLYIALSELNRTELTATERFAIIELFRVTTKTICTALKKHYIEQNEPLTQQKLIIANLRQTLISEVTDSYKLIVEELHDKPDKTDEEKIIFITAICRVLYYINAFLLCRYQLYSAIPENTWQEIYLLYKYAVTHKILDKQMQCELSFNHTTSIIGAFTRIMLLAAVDPYQWRQKDQYSINKAIDLWAVFPTIYSSKQIPDKGIGIYVIDLDQDAPPIASIFRRDAVTASCIALDLTKNVKHLKQLLIKLHHNELRARIEHPGDPEFSVTIPTLTKLIKIWSQRISRVTQRFRMSAKIKVAFGLSSAYYYINNQTEFDPRPSHLDVTTSHRTSKSTLSRAALDLPIFEIEDDEEPKPEPKNEDSTNISESELKIAEPILEHKYPIYEYKIDNISTNGFCIETDGATFPPFQNGEIIIFKNSEQESAPWSLGAVRWIKSPGGAVFHMGIELIAPHAKAAGIQMVRDDQPVGLLLRCLVLPDEPEINTQPVLITPHLPLHSNKVILYLDSLKGIKTSLTQELEATSTYHQYVYSTKEILTFSEPKIDDNTKHKAAINTEQSDQAAEDDKTNTEFDSIWKDL